MRAEYIQQVALLVEVIPFIEKEGCFALKGGTGINLFHRDMPRLSVDIDVTYLPSAGRPNAYANIDPALDRKAKAKTAPAEACKRFNLLSIKPGEVHNLNLMWVTYSMSHSMS